MKIITNGHSRPILGWFELTEKEQSEFNYILDRIDRWYREFGTDYSNFLFEYQFFRYKGWVYDLHDSENILGDSPFDGWLGYTSHTYFSGVVWRYASDDYGMVTDEVVVGHYYT